MWDRKFSGAAWGLGILALALSLHGAHLDLTWFSIDQTREVLTARGIAEGEAYPLVGPTMRGIARIGPLYFYLFAPPFFFSPDPRAVYVYLALLNLLALGLLYRLGCRYLGRQPAFLGTLLFACYPLAVISARGLWPPALLPLGNVLLLWALLAWVVDRKPVGLTLALGLWALLLQVHLTILTLGAVMVLLWVLLRPPVIVRYLLWGATLALLLFSPYLYFQAAHGWEDLGALWSYFSGPQWRQEEVDIPRLLWSTLAMSALLTPDLLREHAGFAAFYRSTQYAYAVLLGLAFLWAGRHAWRMRGKADHPEGRVTLVLLAWALIPAAFILSKRDAIWFYYLDLVYPAPFLLLGLFLARVGDKIGPRLRWAGAAALAILVAAQVAFFPLWWRETTDRGTLAIPSESRMNLLTLSKGVSSPAALEVIPLRYKRELALALAEAGVAGRDAAWQRVHGRSFYDMAEDKGFWFAEHEGGAGGRPGAETEALLLPKGAYPDGGWAGERVVGPLRVVLYRPEGRFLGWRYRSRGGDWVDLPMPARQVPGLMEYGFLPFRTWEEERVQIAGIYRTVRPDRGTRLGLVLEPCGEIRALKVNGSPVVPAAERGEYRLSVGPFLRPGDNLLELEVFCAGRSWDLDLFEVPG